MVKKWTALLLVFSLLSGVFPAVADDISTYQALTQINDPFLERMLTFPEMTPGQLEMFMDDVDDFIASFKGSGRSICQLWSPLTFCLRRRSPICCNTARCQRSCKAL